VWSAGGPLAATVFKVTLAAFVLWVAYMTGWKHSKYAKFVLSLGIITGCAGVFANIATMASL
jgi:hypothetical protein